MVCCAICNREYSKIQFLSRHIPIEHNISKEDYYRKYILPYEPNALNGICARCGKPTRFERFKYYKYCSKECERKDGSIRNAAKAVQTKKANGVYTKVNRQIVEKQKASGIFMQARQKASKTMHENGIYKIIGRKAADTMKQNGTYKIITEKRIATMKKNKSLNTSKAEDRCYDILCKLYSDVKRNYKSDLYPFCCDFYVSSKDLYIECNFHWTHGYHFFNKNDSNDIERFNEMVIKSKTSQYYNKAIEVWTIKDLEKLKCATDNKLNYLVFWSEQDFNKYFLEEII